MSVLRRRLAETLEREEGRKACAYQDHLTYWTIGIGFLIDERVPGAGLRPEEIDFILANRLTLLIEDVDAQWPWARSMDEARYGALLLMAYQLGIPKLLKFKQTLSLLHSGRFSEAASNLARTLWARQTPARAARIREQFRTGEWQ